MKKRIEAGNDILYYFQKRKEIKKLKENQEMLRNKFHEKENQVQINFTILVTKNLQYIDKSGDEISVFYIKKEIAEIKAKQVCLESEMENILSELMENSKNLKMKKNDYSELFSDNHYYLLFQKNS